jgi:uncharacterized repeat protein (TIGR03837 family)
MPFSAKTPEWDIFCTVIDNYGDIGVCWRLARQLVAEHGVKVRLWVDELASFAKICAQIDPERGGQSVQGVEVRHWTNEFPSVVPGDVVIEAFACQLPESFIAAMADRQRPPIWINLDYLSAEAWVSGCHTLPSPHPRLALTKYFFFPGFDQTTGGLLRETGLAAERQAFSASPEQQAALWSRLGQSPPPAEALRVSLFAYENPALFDLLASWARGERRVCCLAPVTRTLAAIEQFAGQSLHAGDVVRRGALEIRLLPFVAQPDYDRLLWSCDVNLVRGEDSFVRAQWAARPLLWQIYPQHEAAHQVKLAAFLDRYCAGLPEAAASAVRALHRQWNAAGRIGADSWAQYLAALPELRCHAELWEKNLSKQEDLCASLFRFCLSKL